METGIFVQIGLADEGQTFHQGIFVLKNQINVKRKDC